MISVNGYFDGNVIQTLEKLNARKNQRVIITLLDEEIQTENSGKKTTAAGFLKKYANPNLIPTEDGAWERAVRDAKKNTWCELCFKVFIKRCTGYVWSCIYPNNAGRLFCLSWVIAEAVYVLKSVYKVERIEISNVLIRFLDEVTCEKKEAIVKGLLLFAETTLDFVDCILIAYNKCYGYEILTFDKKVIKKLIQ